MTQFISQSNGGWSAWRHVRLQSCSGTFGPCGRSAVGRADRVNRCEWNCAATARTRSVHAGCTRIGASRSVRTAGVRRAYGGRTAGVRQVYGRRIAGVRQTYSGRTGQSYSSITGEGVRGRTADVRRAYGRRTAGVRSRCTSGVRQALGGSVRTEQTYTRHGCTAQDYGF